MVNSSGEVDAAMGQIFGNINDPKARDSGRGSLSNPPANIPTPNPIRPYIEEVTSTLTMADAPLSPAINGIGELLRSRRNEAEQRLTEANHLLELSQRRASDLTLDELTEIWQSL